MAKLRCSRCQVALEPDEWVEGVCDGPHRGLTPYNRVAVVIDFGNAEMLYPRHAAEALRSAAGQIDTLGDRITEASGNIRDLNGNTVGSWNLVNDPPAPEQSE